MIPGITIRRSSIPQGEGYLASRRPKGANEEAADPEPDARHDDDPKRSSRAKSTATTENETSPVAVAVPYTPRRKVKADRRRSTSYRPRKHPSRENPLHESAFPFPNPRTPSPNPWIPTHTKKSTHHAPIKSQDRYKPTRKPMHRSSAPSFPTTIRLCVTDDGTQRVVFFCTSHTREKACCKRV